MLELQCLKLVSVQESFENLLSVESSWDKFLQELDATLQGGNAVEKLSVGQSPASDFCLKNARYFFDSLNWLNYYYLPAH